MNWQLVIIVIMFRPHLLDKLFVIVTETLRRTHTECRKHGILPIIHSIESTEIVLQINNESIIFISLFPSAIVTSMLVTDVGDKMCL